MSWSGIQISDGNCSKHKAMSSSAAFNHLTWLSYSFYLSLSFDISIFDLWHTHLLTCTFLRILLFQTSHSFSAACLRFLTFLCLLVKSRPLHIILKALVPPLASDTHQIWSILILTNHLFIVYHLLFIAKDRLHLGDEVCIPIIHTLTLTIPLAHQCAHDLMLTILPSSGNIFHPPTHGRFCSNGDFFGLEHHNKSYGRPREGGLSKSSKVLSALPWSHQPYLSSLDALQRISIFKIFSLQTPWYLVLCSEFFSPGWRT